jgi:hypothetical protein
MLAVLYKTVSFAFLSDVVEMQVDNVDGSKRLEDLSNVIFAK